MQPFRPFIMIATLVVIVSLGCNFLTSTETATQPTLPPAPTEDATQPEQTQQEEPATSSNGEFFTEEFDSDPQWYYEVIEDNGGKSDPENISIGFEGSLMVFEIPDPFLYVYYVYEGNEYEDVRVEINVENRGVNSQQVSLICRAGDEGWYELAIQSDGLWYLFAVSGGGFNRLTNGGSNDIKQGKDVNTYAMECQGNEIAFFINGEEQKGSPYIDREYGLRSGNVGFSISSLRAIPVKVEVDSFTISEP
jgi:hypothetical protein